MQQRFHKTLTLLCVLVLLAGAAGPAALALEAEHDPPTVLHFTEVPIYDGNCCLGSGIQIDGTTYVPLRTFTETMLDASCDSSWDQDTGTATLSTEELLLTLTPEDGYLSVNGRYLYLSDQVYNINGTIVVPIRELAKVFGAEIVWNYDDWSISVDTENCALLENGSSFYDPESLYWLSRVIFSEAGNQPLEGMIGVGNVVLNRAADPRGVFGSGIHGVIFAPGQFDVVPAGTIYCDPSPAAVVAAKLCLEGYSTVGEAKWFFNPAISSSTWFDTYATFVTRIADHDFYA